MARDPRAFTQPWRLVEVHFPEPEWRQRVVGLIAEIEEEGARARALEGKTSQGVKRILMTQPQHRPKTAGRSPKPRFHARKPEVWKRMWESARSRAIESPQRAMTDMER